MRRFQWMTALLVTVWSSLVSVASPVAASPPMTITDNEISEVLSVHNSVRQRVAQGETQRLGGTVSIPDLSWDANLAALAQDWANTLVGQTPYHRPDAQRPDIGENIYWAWSMPTQPDLPPSAAIAWWASEQQYYDYDTNSCAAGQHCGHYTQVVWSSTQRVGCGRSMWTSADGKNNVIWVCNYASAGNITGQRPYGVSDGGNGTPQGGVEQQMVALINGERQQVGCAPLSIDSRLTQAAQGHSQDMANNNFLGQTGSNGSGPGDRMTAAGYTPSSYGENIAAGYTTPQEVLNSWMQTSYLRANVLNCGFMHIGVGHHYNGDSSYGHYWTVLLASPQS